MSPSRPTPLLSGEPFTAHHRIAVLLGDAIRIARRRRRWSLRRLAELAGLSSSAVGAVELGRPATLETYVRLAEALSLEPVFELRARRRFDRLPDEDPVHAAIVELLAARQRIHGHEIRVDQPYQHYQFAGRADLVAIDHARSALLHTEVRTRIPNVGETAGSFNAKCEWLARDLAEREGLRRFLSETHVLVLAWTGEILHTARLRSETLRSLAPAGAAPFDRRWDGARPDAGRHRGLVILDPVDRGASVRRWIDLDAARTARARYRGYAELLEHVRALDMA